MNPKKNLCATKCRLVYKTTLLYDYYNISLHIDQLVKGSGETNEASTHPSSITSQAFAGVGSGSVSGHSASHDLGSWVPRGSGFLDPCVMTSMRKIFSETKGVNKSTTIKYFLYTTQSGHDNYILPILFQSRQIIQHL
jgi:hypothetical protein